MSAEVTAEVTEADVTFWDCRDSEILTHTDPEEAIEDFFEVMFDPKENIRETIALYTPLTVRGYNPENLDEKYLKSRAQYAAEGFEEDIRDEYGNPDGDDEFNPEVREALEADLLAAFQKALTAQNFHVWRCKVAMKKVYTAEEVEAVLRERTDWFKED